MKFNNRFSLTFTGVGEQTDFDGMLEISKEFNVEFAVLAGSRSGSVDHPRFPPLEFVTQFGLWAEGRQMPAAIHLCGLWSRDVNEGNKPYHFLGLVQPFRRVQVNARDRDYYTPNVVWLARNTSCVEVIMQTRDKIPKQPHPKVAYLFDRSGGRGIAARHFPEAQDPSEHHGFAGGIDAGNIARLVGSCESPIDNVWFDIESGVRTDDLMDLEKVREVCERTWRSGPFGEI